MAHFEKKLDSKEIFRGHVIRVTVDTVQVEDGASAAREIVWHNGGACVLALTDKDEIYMVRQFRYALGEELYELPAGKLEPGEDPFAAARRELEEECGVVAETFRNLQPIYPTVGYDSEVIYCWLATDLKPSTMHLDDGEFLTPEKIPFEQALSMVKRGEIRDAKTVCGILKLACMRAEGLV